MIIKKIDINSIFPITINKIIKILEDVNRLRKSISSSPYKLELTVFVIVRIESLNELSKSIPLVLDTDKDKNAYKKTNKN